VPIIKGKKFIILFILINLDIIGGKKGEIEKGDIPSKSSPLLSISPFTIRHLLLRVLQKELVSFCQTDNCEFGYFIKRAVHGKGRR